MNQSVLSKAERALPAQERELLAILIALRKWRCFIDGKEYQVFTDHQPLQYFREQKKPVPRLIRWISEIELYNPDIQYKPGKDNTVPDLLSRRDSPHCTPAETSIEPRYLYTTNVISTNHTLRQTMKSLPDDAVQDWPLIYFRKEDQWPEQLKGELIRKRNKFIVKDQHVFRLKKSANSKLLELQFIPFAKRADLVDKFHISFGHLSQHTVYDQMKARV